MYWILTCSGCIPAGNLNDFQFGTISWLSFFSISSRQIRPENRNDDRKPSPHVSLNSLVAINVYLLYCHKRAGAVVTATAKNRSTLIGGRFLTGKLSFKTNRASERYTRCQVLVLHAVHPLQNPTSRKSLHRNIVDYSLGCWILCKWHQSPIFGFNV